MSATRSGRKPAGPQIAERLEGSPLAKQRLSVFLETIASQLTVPEACQQLGIGPSRFHELRNQTLQATLETLEPRPPGRPAKPTSFEQAEIDTLKAELRRLHVELNKAQTLIHLARIHPSLIGIQVAADDLASKKAADDLAGKKNARRGRQQCRQRRAKRRRRKAK